MLCRSVMMIFFLFRILAGIIVILPVCTLYLFATVYAMLSFQHNTILNLLQKDMIINAQTEHSFLQNILLYCCFRRSSAMVGHLMLHRGLDIFNSRVVE